MSQLRIGFLVIPAAIGGTMGTIDALNNEIKTLRRQNFRIVPDIFKIGGRISLGAGSGAVCGALWPIYGGILAYNFIDEISKLG